MPSPNRRLTPLRSGDVRWLGNRGGSSSPGGGVQYASCNKNVTQVNFTAPQKIARGLLPGGGIYVSGKTVGLITAVFALFVFGPLSTPGVVLGYGGAGTGTAYAITSSGALGNAGFFGTGLFSTLGFTSPYIRQAQYAQFTKPCTGEGGF